MQLTRIHCSLPNLSSIHTPWLAANPNTSTVILGASKPEQVVDNLKALEVIPKLTPEILEKIEKILDNKPSPYVRRLFSLLFRRATEWSFVLSVRSRRTGDLRSTRSAGSTPCSPERCLVLFS